MFLFNDLSKIGKTITYLLLVYLFLDYLAPRGILFWRGSYAIFYIVVTLIFFTKINKIRLGKWFIFFIWVNLIFLLPILNQEVIYPKYIIGDLAINAFPLLLFVCIKDNSGLINEGYFKKISVIILIFTLVGLASAKLNLLPSYNWNGRFDPPHLLLISIVIGGFKKSTIESYILLISIILLSFLSGNRTEIFLILIGTAYSIFIYWNKSVIAKSSVLLILVLIGMSLFPMIISSTYVQDSRFKEINNLNDDESLIGRYNEVVDVIKEVNDAEIFESIIGHGYGATFEPIYSAPHYNATKDNLVHNIHFGPARIFFRFGIIGTILVVALIIMLIKDIFFFLQKTKFTKRINDDSYFILHLYIVLNIPNFFLRILINDPIFIFGLVLYLIKRKQILHDSSKGSASIRILGTKYR